MAARLVIPTIFTAVDKISGIIRRISSNTKTFADKMNVGIAKGNRLFNKLTPSISGARAEMLNLISTTSIFLGLLAGASFSYKAITDYEVALHSLEAVTGESYSKFQNQIEGIAKKSNVSAIEVTKSFETIGSAMSEYLNNPEALGKITDAGIILSKAARVDLEPALDDLTNIMNQFSLGADQALYAVNRLSAGEIVGSVRTARLATEMKDVGGIAYFNKIKLGEMTAAMEVMGKRIPHDQLGRVSRNMVLFMSSASAASNQALASMDRLGISTDVLMNKNISFGERLKELSKAKGDAIAMEAIFGKENVAGATQLLNNLPLYEEWAKKIETTNKAQEQAAINSNTLAKATEAVKNQFINSMVSGDKLTPTLDKVKTALYWVAKNMDTILYWTFQIVKWWVITKVTLLALEGAMAIYNVALGINTFLTKGNLFALRGNTIALGAYKIVSIAVTAATWLWNTAVGVMTAAQWGLNVALDANPIGLVIIAIAALIGLVYVIIKYYDEWGATILMLMGPFGSLINIIVSVYKHWDEIKKAFKDGGIIAGLKMIGKVILDALLMPVQQLLEMLSEIPGLGNLAAKGISNISEMRQSLNLESPQSTTQAPVLNSPLVTSQTTNNNNNNWLGIDIKGNGNPFTTKQTGSPLIPIKVTSTQNQR